MVKIAKSQFFGVPILSEVVYIHLATPFNENTASQNSPFVGVSQLPDFLELRETVPNKMASGFSHTRGCVAAELAAKDHKSF